MAGTLTQYEEITGTTLEEYLAGGGLAGEFNSRYYRWNENPEAFYESIQYPYASIYEDIVDDKYRKKYLQPVQAELERIKNQAEQKDLTKDGYFKIGTVELTIPPIQISINEVKQNYTYKTLRTSSDVIFQSGKSTKIIELDIYFHDIEEINNKLRPLLAQLKCTPFVPIYSGYLKEILEPTRTEKREIARAEKAKAMSDANAKIARRRHDLIEAINNEPGLTEARPTLVPDIHSYWAGTLTTNLNRSGVDPYKPLSESMKTIMTEVGIADTFLLKDGILDVTTSVETDVQEFKNIMNTNFAGMEGTIVDKNIVGVLSQINVATVAGFPESLVCHATFFIFNYFPFSDRFEFLDSKNNPTTDVDKCSYFIQWYASRFLNQPSDADDGTRYFRPLESEMKGELSFDYVKEDLVINEYGEKVPKETPLPKVMLDSNTVCAAIVVSQRNSVSFLPVLQWSVPTCQYLGSHNANVSLTIDTLDDDFMERIKHMIDFCEKSAREGDKVTRANYIRVNNEILALLGIRNCVVDGFQTSTIQGSPGMTRIQMNLTEFNPRQLAGEVIARQKDVPEDVQLEYFKNDVQKYLDEINFANYKVVSRTPLRGFLDGIDIYKRAAGQKAIVDTSDEYSSAYSGPLSMLYLSEKGVNFNHEKKRIAALKEVINDMGSSNARKKRVVTQGLRFSSSENRSLDFKETYIKVKDSRTADERDYSYMDKLAVADYLKSYLSNTSHTKSVKDIPDSVLYLVFKTDDLSTYRETAINNIKNFVNGTGSILSEDLQASLSKSKLLLNIKRKATRYPDMTLPEYATTKRVGVGSPKITFGDLGKPSPSLPPNQNSTPRTDGDIVEPDFYFNNGIDIDIQDVWDKFDKIFEEEYARALSDIGSKVNSQMRESENLSVIPADDMSDVSALEATDQLIKTRRERAIIYKDGTAGPELIQTTAEENADYEKAVELGRSYDPADYDTYLDAAVRLENGGRYSTDGSAAQEMVDSKQYYVDRGTTVLASSEDIYGLNVDASKKEPKEPEDKDK